MTDPEDEDDEWEHDTAPDGLTVWIDLDANPDQVLYHPDGSILTTIHPPFGFTRRQP